MFFPFHPLLVGMRKTTNEWTNERNKMNWMNERINEGIEKVRLCATWSWRRFDIHCIVYMYKHRYCVLFGLFILKSHCIGMNTHSYVCVGLFARLHDVYVCAVAIAMEWIREFIQKKCIECIETSSDLSINSVECFDFFIFKNSLLISKKGTYNSSGINTPFALIRA